MALFFWVTFKIYLKFFTNFKWEICFISLQYTHRLTPCYSSKHLSGWCFPRCAVTILSIRRSWRDDIGPPFGCGWISQHRLGVVLYADVGVLLINREGNRMWQGEGEWEARNRANRSSLLTAAGLAGADGERERGTQVWHWSDGTGPAGFDLRKEDEHVWTTDESTKLSEAAGSLSEKKWILGPVIH